MVAGEETTSTGRQACVCCHALEGVVGVEMCGACRSLAAYVEGLRADVAELMGRIDEALAEHHRIHDANETPGFTLDVESTSVDPPLRLLLERPAPYRPAAKDLAIAQRHPDLDWFVHLPPADRLFWRTRDGLQALVARHPDVEEDAWVTLLRTAG